MWNNIAIKNHLVAAKKLLEIKDLAFDYLRKHNKASEYELQEFIFKKFRDYNLKTDSASLITAFNENSAIPHYYPALKSKKFKKETIVLIDIWAKLNCVNAPFTDITWIGYYGDNLPAVIEKNFNIVKKARDNSISFIRNELKKKNIPTGKEIDKIARDTIIKAGFGDNFIHKTGHCLGYTSPHGKGKNISKNNNTPLKLNYGYTIEPGIYLKSKFGIRSEIDFYITKHLELIITTNVQRKIIKI